MNKVQKVFDNRAGGKEAYYIDALGKSFAEGWRLDVAAYDAFVPNGCHQEVEIKLCRVSEALPLVSVVIPCYKQAHFLGEALDSVRAQTYPNIECIVVDDGSPDDTAAVVERYIADHPSIALRLVCKANGGLSDARNAGIANARGDYILPLDSDDRLHPDMVKQTLSALEQSGADIAYTDIQHFGERSDTWQTGPLTLVAELADNRIPYCSLYRRAVFDKVGGYSADLNSYEDWDFWIGALEKGFRGVKVPGAYFHYRKSPCSMLVDANKRRPYLIAQIVLRHPALYDAATISQACELLSTPAESAAIRSGRPKRVLIACDYYWPSVGGVETIAANFGSALVQLGFEVDVAARALPERTVDIYRSMRIHSLDAITPGTNGLSKASIQLRELIETGKYSAVVIQADPLNWVIWSLEGLRKPEHTKVFVQPLINEEGYAKWAGLRDFRQRLGAVLRRSDLVVCLTNQGPDTRFLNEERISFIQLPNATTPVETLIDFRREYGFDVNKPLLVHVANLWPVKNHLNLVSTFKKLEIDCQLALIGNPSSDIDYVNQVHAAVAGDSRIKLMHGFASEQVAAAMKAADLVLLASLGEVFPVTILEAMSHAKAWLATPECGAANELSGGIIAPLKEFPCLITKLLQDRGLLTRLGELGYAHWNCCNDWSVVAGAWQQLIVHGRLTKDLAPPDVAWTETLQIRSEILQSLPSTSLPLVSVIVPTFNRPLFLKDALNSIRKQTYPNWEAIVINDGGEDVSNIVRSMPSSKRFVLLDHEFNKGMSAARNTGLNAAKGEFICYLDDDDIFKPEHLKIVVEAMQRLNADFVYTDSEYIVEALDNGHRIEKDRQYRRPEYKAGQLLVHNFIPVNCWAHRRSCLKSVGLFDETISSHEDWEFLIRMGIQFELIRVPEVTVEVHQREVADNMLRRSGHREFYEEIYRRFPVSDPDVIALRESMLSRFDQATIQRPASIEGISNSGVQDISDAYKRWQSAHKYMESGSFWLSGRIDGFKESTRFHLVIIVQSAPTDLLLNSLKSLAQQLYGHWHLTVVSTQLVPDLLLGTPTVTWIQTVQQELLQVANQAMLDRDSDWVGQWSAGDQLAPQAFFIFAETSKRHPEFQAIFSDEDNLDAKGTYFAPFFKTDFDLELLRSAPFALGGMILVRKSKFAELGGYQSELDGAETYDLILRLWESSGSAAIGHVQDVLYHRSTDAEHARRSAEFIQMAGKVALDEHFLRLGIPAGIEDGLLTGTARVRYRLAEEAMVSVIIPTHDAGPYVQRCLNALRNNTAYKNVEVIVVDQGSSQPDAQIVLDRIGRGEWGDSVRFVKCGGDTSLPAMINAGARISRGEYLLLLADAAAPLQPDWLGDMLGYMAQPDIGVVGPKMVGSDTKVSFAGYILGLDGRIAGMHDLHQPIDAPGYFGRLLLPNSPSAVSAACLLTRKSLFDELGGFDEAELANDSSDVDYCLKVWQSGHRVVWTPFSVMLLDHVVEPPKGEALEDAEIEGQRGKILYLPSKSSQTMLDRWRDRIAFDPAYNRNLSFTSGAFEPEPVPALTWDPAYRPLQRVFVLPADRWGCGEYRIIAPLRALVNAGKIQGVDSDDYVSLPELFRMAPDSVIFQRQIKAVQVRLMEMYRRNSKAFHVFELDDLFTNIQLGNSARREVHHKDLVKVFRQALNQCDRFVVSTDILAEEYSKYKNEIVVVQNRLERAKWGGLSGKRRQGRKPRVGWAGSTTHDADLAIIADVVKALKDEVEWVFMALQPKGAENMVEFHAGVPIGEYPAKLASLNLDLALAPLEDVPFNHAKSHLRLLEYGVLGYPVICTDITPYRGPYPVTRVRNRYKDWLDAIREHISDMDELARRGDALRDHVKANWILEDHLDDWLKAWLPN